MNQILTSPTIDPEGQNFLAAKSFCEQKGAGWGVLGILGRGGTASVYELSTPFGTRALKIYDLKFSSGQLGDIEMTRIEQQVSLGEHDCRYLVKTYEGGSIDKHLFILMNRPSGKELEKNLTKVPRNKIRQIVDQIAKAVLYLSQLGLCHRDIKTANIYISDDFEHATLLDLSVTRKIYDPVGLGTDSVASFPVLATARYSPPEYLFRLVDTSEKDLWHALNIYQLGALLYDLIMQESIFEEEYKISKDNKYRFAWIVATTIPIVEANDIDLDLVHLANQALTKDWKKRLSLKVEDFLEDTSVRTKHALTLIGINSSPIQSPLPPQPTISIHQVTEFTSMEIATCLSEAFKKVGLLSRKEIIPTPCDGEKIIRLWWNAPANSCYSGEIEFQGIINLESTNPRKFSSRATINCTIDNQKRSLSVYLPDVVEGENSIRLLTQQFYSSLGQLSSLLIKQE